MWIAERTLKNPLPKASTLFALRCRAARGGLWRMMRGRGLMGAGLDSAALRGGNLRCDMGSGGGGARRSRLLYRSGANVRLRRVDIDIVIARSVTRLFGPFLLQRELGGVADELLE